MNDHGFDRLCEIDKWRFINFIRLQIQTKKPVLLDLKYLGRQGFDFTTRRLTSTINQLKESELVTIRMGSGWDQDGNSEGTGREQRGNSEGTEQEQKPKIVTTKGLKKKSVTQSRVEKSRVDIHVRVFTEWNRMAIKQHRNIDKYTSSINGALEYYSEQEIIQAMNNYKLVLVSDKHYYSHFFTLDKFLAQKNGLENFVSGNKPFEAYKNKSNNFVQDNRQNGVAI